MSSAPGITRIAALLSDPTRSLMMSALMDGRALTVTELARSANITIQTASEHLSKLEAEGLVGGEKQGRHRYFRLAGVEVAHLIESLMQLSADRGRAAAVATGPKNAALRQARICYDHLAGERGVELLDGLKRKRWVVGESELALTDTGTNFFTEFGIEVATLKKGRRPLCRACLDWSERRSHLAGALGAALFDRLLELHWIEHARDRVIRFTPLGEAGFARHFGEHASLRLVAGR